MFYGDYRNKFVRIFDSAAHRRAIAIPARCSGACAKRLSLNWALDTSAATTCGLLLASEQIQMHRT
jgi:hypothetical protein